MANQSWKVGDDISGHQTVKNQRGRKEGGKQQITELRTPTAELN